MWGYMEAHDYPLVTENMNPRTHRCIAIVPIRNIQVNNKVLF